MKKFELTTEQKINWFGHTLYRIKACMSFTTTNGFEVNEGDLGGWVEKEQNLSHTGKAWVWGNAKVCGDANLFSTEHIDLTPAEPENKPCPFCGGNGELDSDADVVVCQECGASADKKFWNNRV